MTRDNPEYYAIYKPPGFRRLSCADLTSIIIVFLIMTVIVMIIIMIIVVI